ncbi:rap guanine nucleotide exchange factor 5 isoform X1 [Macaca nemestrina]|uniref:Rap guanine nucleotide exchange factor 5 n=9 Tax=Cercopithecinae TaxID=9528 RepID=F6WAW0_MACMU|nr:rap guanine nucleotide exchange factor 5 [Macaca nemestrina]XP_011936482.1 PREDICTED: rap guanine nucleotide exchange factor 5 [Cercocebus atys]XP_014989362.2 rap guanine nucleotide exchange factor 5 isoform X1 [Macaca mulatta]XP_015303126.2 rap guanine nucleotide exchange factor 5 isoform X1 [Macaca fascicularis]XP_021791650.2 rap guanine nucleotide exchange factor 5 isoform X1 [Papio anubis]XP_025236152.1 rap guanine nucleotide exchange factor 5 [Theropithecus gelada]XP_050639081.1 rap g
MRMAVGSVKMQPPCESPALAAAAAVVAADGALRRSPSAREPEREQPPASLRPRLRDLPALLRSGLTLRRKRSAAGGRTLSRRISNPYLEHTPSQIYGENSSCAGRALRNIIIVQAADLIKDRVNLKGFYRRSCVGSELVDWLLEHCPFVQCRSMAIGVWQLLLDMGIMLSVDQHLYFQDTYVFYQFSSDECSYLYCEFEREEEWQNGVKLLLQLVPLIPARAGICELSHQKIEDSEESSDEILARLTSAVQRELAAVIALKARKSAIEQDEENNDKHVAVTEAESVPDSQAGVMCKLQERDEIGRIELVQKLARENYQFLQTDKKEQEKSEHQDDEVTTVQVKEQDQSVLVLKKVQCCGPAPTAGSAESHWRYVVVSGTPEKILEHLLNDLHLEEVQDKETETLLDDFLLTYTVFMTTDDLCQALLRHYSAKKYQGKEENSDVPRRKRKVLHLVSQWIALYKDWLHEDEHSKMFLKTIYRNVLDDVYEYPILEKELKEFQKILGMHRRHTVDEYSPQKKNKALFHQFSLKENWLQHRGTVTETEEIFCHVYITEHSYVSVKAKVSSTAQEILKFVAEKIQYAEEDLALVAITFSGGKHELQPNDLVISKSLEASGRIYVYRKDLADTLNPFAENEESQQRSMRILGMNTWDLALELMNFDWSLFNSIHEQELIYFTFSRQGSGEHTANLSLLLQRCNEVQLWVATEILLCSQLGKRVQLVKKFIKIAAHCKAQRNLNSFFAIVMGLNTASVSRLSQTWEKIPGKFKKLFSELESLTDPSLNHKAYRDAFKKMKPPKIPFMPLLLKDVTFIHEGNKTFLDNLVNFEKLHMIADTVRTLRHCRTNQFGDLCPKEHQELKSYVNHLYVIDSQQALFELSHRIEPRV